MSSGRKMVVVLSAAHVVYMAMLPGGLSTGTAPRQSDVIVPTRPPRIGLTTTDDPIIQTLSFDVSVPVPRRFWFAWCCMHQEPPAKRALHRVT